MKEININIEGYNVNGICVGCLNYNRTMFYHPMVKECFRLLGNIDVPDGLDIQICWECLAYVKTAMRFKARMTKSYEFLILYSMEHPFLESPKEFEPHSSTRLSVKKVETLALTENLDSCKNEGVKEEGELEEEKFDLEFQIKEESIPISIDDAQFDGGYPSAEYVTSEDEQLSKIKQEKVEKQKNRVKKKRKRKEEMSQDSIETKPKQTDIKQTSRKLKNLPEDMVELYTMTEEEMWKIREEDLNSVEFQKRKYKCELCILAFNTEKLMLDHLNGKHQPKGGGPACRICRAHFLTREHVSTHEALHARALRCVVCSFSTALKGRMASHVVEHRGVEQIKGGGPACRICRAHFLTREHVSTHEALHARALRCVVCSFSTALKGRMASHVVEHRGVEQFVCASCGVSFSTKSKLSYHKSVCSQDRPQCDCCGKVFANKTTLKYHLKAPNKQVKDENTKESLYIPCKGCDKVFHSKKSYRAHVVIHDGLTYPCSVCGKPFQWKRNLARHMRNHRERASGALHECRPCGKTFASRDCYNNHMRLSKRHVAEDTYLHECNYCGKKFATKWCLTDHVDWDHLKRVKYQCAVCFKPFKTAKIMVAHTNNIHGGRKKEAGGEGEHLCDICGKSYKTVKRLKGHVWAMHTMRSTTKSYKCKLCPAMFTWQTSIYKHMKMMHSPAKKNKPRAMPVVKKEEAYPVMQYFQQNLSNNLNIVHVQQII